MNLETIFAAQIASALGYIGATFVLYRLLVSQKDATIEALKQQNALLVTRLETADASGPDALAARLTTRIELLTAELERLGKDHDANRAQIAAKEAERSALRSEMSVLQTQVSKARELMADLVCPYCDALIAEKRWESHSVDYGGRDVDIDSEHLMYECGLYVVNGEEHEPCRNAASS
jgi:C4-dicarboxylate-specific signal transduction histidine kinase